MLTDTIQAGEVQDYAAEMFEHVGEPSRMVRRSNHEKRPNVRLGDFVTNY